MRCDIAVELGGDVEEGGFTAAAQAPAVAAVGLLAIVLAVDPAHLAQTGAPYPYTSALSAALARLTSQRRI